MARERLVSQTVDSLLEAIVSGTYAVDKPLPAQPVLAEELEVSRLTVREAVETLRSRGIVRVVHGSGTYVVPTSEWTDADAISRLVGRDGAGQTVSVQILEARRLIEIGAAEMCAERRTSADVDELGRLLGVMRAAHKRGGVEDFVIADMGFHDVILLGCRNPFLAAVYQPLMRVLQRTRTETSIVPLIREHAIDQHAAILDAIRASDGPRARASMASHMDQTARDLAEHVLGSS